MASGNIKHYLGCGLAADRPVALDLSPGALGIYHASDTDELWLWVDNERWESRGTGSDGIPDAPSDGKLYGRQDAAWTEVETGGGGQDTGYATINDQTGTAYTLVLSDAGALVTMNNASANTLTVPPDSDVAFPVGTRVDLGQDGAGQTTVAAGSGVTIRTPETLVLRKQWAKATLIKRAADTWDLEGNLEAAP